VNKSRQAVLEIEDLSVAYATHKGMATAVDRLSLTVYENEVLGIVGESGCGKSTLAQAVMRMLGNSAYVTGGTVKVMGQDVYRLRSEELRKFRWAQMSMVFQGAMNVLNPVKNIESQIVDTLQAHRPEMTKKQAVERAHELFALVRIDPARLRSFPHELSGGMRQRVVIAIAIALEPKLIIMDEPTTALDVIVQKSILEQIMQLREQVGFAIVLISHDISLVAEISQRVGVMYAGRLIELSESARDWRERLHHPYTQGLIHAIPTLDVTNDEELNGIPGAPPSLHALPGGCPFHPRCAQAKPVCSVEPPPLTTDEQKQIACHLSTAELRGLNHVY